MSDIDAGQANGAMVELTAELLLRAYAMGVFPMAERHDDPQLYWVDPEQRGILPLESFHVPRSLRKTLRHGAFTIKCDTAFEQVMRLCGESTANRPETWINEEILRLFCELHRWGLAHSVECWCEGELAGGLYGLALGSAFFGESMFSRRIDASKVALVHLVARLRKGGFTLLDTQFVTDHLSRFGATEIPRWRYREMLTAALVQPADFYCDLGAGDLSALF